ncbi:hypothetical protein Tco_0424944 [Tanacetum coccineum]
MLCFESAMEKQRYTQRVLDNTTVEKTPVMLTQLPIEHHACEVYTHSIFRDVQHEIYKGLYACSHIASCSEGGIEYCVIRQKDKRNNTVVDAMVSFIQLASKFRELEEIKAGGFGKGELQGPYVEEVDPMPHNDEERNGFGRTLMAGFSMFRGNILIDDLYHQYREILQYKQTRRDQGDKWFDVKF